jgi:hypothetical protein
MCFFLALAFSTLLPLCGMAILHSRKEMLEFIGMDSFQLISPSPSLCSNSTSLSLLRLLSYRPSPLCIPLARTAPTSKHSGMPRSLRRRIACDLARLCCIGCRSTQAGNAGDERGGPVFGGVCIWLIGLPNMQFC